jgi:hypothetical protein
VNRNLPGSMLSSWAETVTRGQAIVPGANPRVSHSEERRDKESAFLRATHEKQIPHY